MCFSFARPHQERLSQSTVWSFYLLLYIRGLTLKEKKKSWHPKLFDQRLVLHAASRIDTGSSWPCTDFGYSNFTDEHSVFSLQELVCCKSEQGLKMESRIFTELFLLFWGWEFKYISCPFSSSITFGASSFVNLYWCLDASIHSMFLKRNLIQLVDDIC